MISWSEITRRQYRRDGLRYASDLTDEEWQLIAPHLPPAKLLGRPRETDLREAVNAMLYVLTTGCQWRLLPTDFPPYTTVQRFFYGWRDRHLAPDQPPSAAGRPRGGGSRGQPVAGVIDSQWLTTEAGGPRGYDAGKKIKGRKRHILTDTNGLLVAATVHAADIQDRDGAVPLLASIRHPFPWLRHVFADGGYAGAKLETALAALGNWTLGIVKRCDITKGFELLPRRWVVERTLASLNRNRRLAKDFEALIETAAAWLFLASVKLLLRRTARG